MDYLDKKAAGTGRVGRVIRGCERKVRVRG